MAQIDFNSVFETLKGKVSTLAQDTVKDYASQATLDGHNILNEMKTDLQTWLTQLASGDITADDLQWLVGSDKVLLEMVALKQAGIAQAELDNFKSGIVNI